MGLTVYQCCFTNTGQDVGSQAQVGWHDVAVSPEIPPRAHDFCVVAQNAVASNPARKRGGVKSLYEILCDGAYVYAIRTALNVTDNLGRANIFSHAYIFLAREVLNNPDAFLSLSLDNFKTSEKDALQWDGHYDSLIREEEITLEAARKIAGADSPEAYQSLIYCAYAQMAHHGKPLFLRYKTPGENVTEADLNLRIRAFLLCVWSGLPFFLRRKFSAVSVPELGGREFDIVMTKSDKPREGLWNAGGIAQNSGIVTPQTQSRIKRYFYLEYAQKLMENPGELSVYYAWLDRNAAEWGDAANETVLKLLAQQYQRKPSSVDYAKNPALKCVPASFPTDELQNWLSDAEKAPPPASANIRTCVKRMRDEYETRKTKRNPSQSKEDAWRKWEEAKREAQQKKGEKAQQKAIQEAQRKQEAIQEAQRKAQQEKDEAEREARRKQDEARRKPEEAEREARRKREQAETEARRKREEAKRNSGETVDFSLEIPGDAILSQEFTRLVKNCLDAEFGDRDGEQWADVNEFFAKHPGLPSDAHQKLSEYLFQNRSKSHTLPWYQSWTRLMVALGPVSGGEEEIRDELIRIYRAMSPPDCQTLCKYVPPMLNRLKGRKSYVGGMKDCRALFMETLKSACTELDETRSNGAPLDMWLLLGEARHGQSNCFDVFNQSRTTTSGDGANAKILNVSDVSPETVIRESCLLRISPYKSEYAGYAEQIRKKAGTPANLKKVIQQWLKKL